MPADTIQPIRQRLTPAMLDTMPPSKRHADGSYYPLLGDALREWLCQISGACWTDVQRFVIARPPDLAGEATITGYYDAG